MADVTISGGQSEPTNVTINYTYDPLYRLTADYSDTNHFQCRLEELSFIV
jgi:hypothetical protein